MQTLSFSLTAERLKAAAVTLVTDSAHSDSLEHIVEFL